MDIADSTALANSSTVVEFCLSRGPICVTNSGAPPSNENISTAPEAWRAAADQLLRSTIHSAKKSSPRIQKRDWGELTTSTSSAINSPVDDGLFRSLL